MAIIRLGDINPLGNSRMSIFPQAGSLGSVFPTRRESYLLLAFYALVVGLAIADATSFRFHQDAYFYFTIARNLADGAGLTFDGVSTTTGFHPLWLGITTAVYWFFSDIASFQIAVFSLLVALFIGAHFLLSRVASAIGISVQAFILVSLPVFIINLSTFQLGVENTLLLFLLSLFLWLQFRVWNSSISKAAVSGLVLLLVYFARLDAIFFIALYLPYFFVKEWRNGNSASAVLLPAIVGGGVLIHWIIMLSAFDTIFPTSQLAIRQVITGGDTNILEALAPREHPFTTRISQLIGGLGRSSNNPIQYAGLVVPISLVVSLLLLARRNLARHLPLILVGLAELLLVIYYAVFMDGFTRPWYFTGAFIVTSLGLAYLLSGVAARINLAWAGVGMSMIMAIILVVNINRADLDWSYYSDRSQLLDQYNQGENVLVGNTPDIAAFYSDVPIRHLEGLVNGYDYLRTYAADDRIASYVADIGATHYVISNSPVLPNYMPCVVGFATDAGDGLAAYGAYDSHNSYVAVYRISTAPAGAAPSPDRNNDECGPAVGP